jgi:putative chitinase
MQVTEAHLRALTAARGMLLYPIAAAITAYSDAFGVSKPVRLAHFIAQVAIESAGFARLEENLNYTTPARIAAIWPRLIPRAAALVRNPPALANAAYAGKNGNGDESSGDGWRYRGRGLIQLTGRANYAAAGSGIGEDLIANPDDVSTPEIAVRTALWFWQAHGCNDLADADNSAAITRAVNGPAMEQAEARRALEMRAIAIFI